MSRKPFPWGKVIDRLTFDFDGETLEVTKYHPWKTRECEVRTGDPNLDEIAFHVQEIRQSFDNVYAAVIAWVAFKHLGHNQNALASGICRALAISK